jgi:hypothetical protein
MNIDVENYVTPSVCSLLDHTGNDTGHSKTGNPETHNALVKYYQPYMLHYDLNYFTTGIMTTLHYIFYIMMNDI